MAEWNALTVRAKRSSELVGLLRKIGFVLIAFALLSGSTLWATPVTLSWQAPTTNVDGTSLTDLAGYTVYWVKKSHTYATPKGSLDVGNVTTVTIDIPMDGVFFFVVTAYDTAGNESAYSNEAHRVTYHRSSKGGSFSGGSMK